MATRGYLWLSLCLLGCVLGFNQLDFCQQHNEEKVCWDTTHDLCYWDPHLSPELPCRPLPSSCTHRTRPSVCEAKRGGKCTWDPAEQLCIENKQHSLVSRFVKRTVDQSTDNSTNTTTTTTSAPTSAPTPAPPEIFHGDPTWSRMIIVGVTALLAAFLCLVFCCGRIDYDRSDMVIIDHATKNR